ncbi:MAG: hypothetical protein M0R48_11845 [Candidatus Omnitrophica bacterium]|nr:hypothetical protein [Candidatus Omnitrophota bacterium]
MKTYTGTIENLKDNQIFVFGSNKKGAHGKGAAFFARQNCGAVYGQARGLQGRSYAIVTKDLTKDKHPSIDAQEIKKQIQEFYCFASENPEKEFVVAYSGTGKNLNGYSCREMADMFSSFEIPKNVVFEQSFADLILNYGPLTDGVTHINIYTKGKTKLGRDLTNLSRHGFEMKEYGRFECVEGFWYYYLTGCQHEEFRKYDGFTAKTEGQKLREDRIDKDGLSDVNKGEILEAIRCKLRQNRDVLKNLIESELPLTHYYYYGEESNCKIVRLHQYDWIVEEIENIRTACKAYYRRRNE